MDETGYRVAERRFWGTYDLRPTERFVRLASTGTRVRVQEVGDGEPVLFVHGSPNAGATWAPLVAHLSGYRCLLVDRPGTGLSEPFPIRPANLAAIGARFVGDVLDGFGVDRAHVVASSFGGHLALRSAAHTPGRFRRMVQMACPALVPGDRMPPFMLRLGNPLMRWIAARVPPDPKANEEVMRAIGHGASLDAGRLPAAMMDWYLELQRTTDTRRNDYAMIASAAGDPDPVRLREADFRAVPVPTLFLWGADDTFGDESVARRLVGWMPDADLTMLPRCGHLPWLDEPARLAGLTLAFLAGSDAGAVAPATSGRASGGQAQRDQVR
jgi:2-hydroxy-6-oxonona-2,4-dienedioate hydrolase